MRSECSGLCMRMNSSIHLGPAATMKMLRTRIVTPAKTELTSPKPMSRSTPAASPALLGSLLASSESFWVMSYLLLRSLSVLFLWT